QRGRLLRIGSGGGSQQHVPAKGPAKGPAEGPARGPARGPSKKRTPARWPGFLGRDRCAYSAALLVEGHDPNLLQGLAGHRLALVVDDEEERPVVGRDVLDLHFHAG